MKTNDVQIEIEKVSEEKEKMKISQHQQRKKTSRKGNTHTSGSQGARGGGDSAKTKYFKVSAEDTMKILHIFLLSFFLFFARLFRDQRIPEVSKTSIYHSIGRTHTCSIIINVQCFVKMTVVCRGISHLTMLSSKLSFRRTDS